MLTKLKVFAMKTAYNYYGFVLDHYFDKAYKLIKMGDYERADKYHVIAAKYLKKKLALVSDLVEMA